MADETLQVINNEAAHRFEVRLGDEVAFADRTFSFVTKTPPVSYFLKKAAGVSKGSSTTGRGIAGKVTVAQCREIAEAKMKDLNAHDVDGAVQMIIGSARSMGLEVTE